MCLFELWFSQGVCPVVELLGHMVVLGLPGGSVVKNLPFWLPILNTAVFTRVAFFKVKIFLFHTSNARFSFVFWESFKI